jgi:hypothetical protein
MARVGKAKDPERELAALFEKRVGRAHKRHEIENAITVAQRVVDEAPERRRAVLLSEARGEQLGETVVDVENDRRKAEAEIAGGRERAEALRTVEKEIEAEVDAVIDAHPDHFVAAAVAASDAASEAISAAVNATQAAVSAWLGTREAWGRVRLSRRRRGLELGPEVPINDLGSAVFELEQSQSRPFPGGSRANYERFVQWESGQRVIRTADAPKREPLIERIGGE